jgi:hypothetical protein
VEVAVEVGVGAGAGDRRHPPVKTIAAAVTSRRCKRCRRSPRSGLTA